MPRPHEIHGMSRVHSAYNAFEAYLWRDRLRSDGISAQVRNERLVGAMGELPAQEVMVEVWVPREDENRASAILRHALDPEEECMRKKNCTADLEVVRSPLLSTPSHCPSCQSPWEPGFDTCWNCCETLTFD